MFQPISALIGDHNVVAVRTTTTVQEALAVMVEKDYSQLPVVGNLIDEDYSFPIPLTPVVGFFTQRRLMSLIDTGTISIASVLNRPVSEFMEDGAPVVTSDRSVYDVARLLSQRDAIAVIVAESDQAAGVEVLGIITDYDISNFLVVWSEGIAIIEAIESYLRGCIVHVLPTEEKRQAALCRVFGTDKADGGKPAKAYDELTLWEHQQLITDAKLWPDFEPYLQPKETFLGFMQVVRPIRNQVAHFRGELNDRQRRHLRDAREWLARHARAWSGSDAGEAVPF